MGCTGRARAGQRRDCTEATQGGCTEAGLGCVGAAQRLSLVRAAQSGVYTDRDWTAQRLCCTRVAQRKGAPVLAAQGWGLHRGVDKGGRAAQRWMVVFG